MLEAGGCRMVTDVIDRGNDEVAGSVVLLHGLSANKKIMAYLARAFAKQNLRVFVPDLPGHGRTPGPFSFSRAETCGDSFVRQLTSRGLIEPARTILAGHSMGGAIAIRIAPHIRAAGVIAISPAPMSTKHGIANNLLPFEEAPPSSVKMLVISGGWEPQGIRETARDLIDGVDSPSRYELIPHATHVSLIFDPRVARASQGWAEQALGLSSGATAPSLLPLAGSLIGFVGVLLLAGPFLRETFSTTAVGNAHQPAGPSVSSSAEPRLFARLRTVPYLYVACVSIAAVALLNAWQPLAFVRLFDGGYFFGFLLVVGLLVLPARLKEIRGLADTRLTPLLTATVAGLIVFLLVSAWVDATLMEAWLTWSRWARLPVLVTATLPYLVAEELIVPSVTDTHGAKRIVSALMLRAFSWPVMLFAIFVLHHGPILMLLLAPYFALLSIGQRAGMDVVRTETRSAAAAALFGAILLAGFCLVIFPVT